MGADFTMTADLLASHQIICPVSEIHGVICGQLCSGNPEYDLELSLKVLEIEGPVEKVITDLLTMLAEDIRAQFLSPDFSFQPLLPDDDEDFGTRLDALSCWCDGFNAGFAAAWQKGDTAVTEEVREVLSDFVRIAEMDTREEDGAPEGENEADYMEVVEYARMAAIMVYLQNASQQFSSTAGQVEEPGDNEIH